MIYNSLTDRQDAGLADDSGHGSDFSSSQNSGTRSVEDSVEDIAGSDNHVGDRNNRPGLDHSPTNHTQTKIAAMNTTQSDHELDQVSDIGTDREKLREIRDWHLSKAQMSWSLETQQRHQQFVAWLEEAIAAIDLKA